MFSQGKLSEHVSTMNKSTNCWLKSVGDLFFAEQILLSCNSKNSAWDLEVTSDYNITLLVFIIIFISGFEQLNNFLWKGNFWMSEKIK